ncbi:MAG: D-aminoacylase [Acidobacteria bacterium]|nr:D-aminoacylase [Acidobacteriota bacterium]
MLALTNGTVFDGRGGAPFSADVHCQDGRITSVAPGLPTPPAEVIDCTGLAIAPGFLDLHSHSDLQVLDGRRQEKIKQGVTAELVGNCGFSAFPCGSDAGLLRTFAGGIFREPGDWGWPTASEYFNSSKASPGATDVYALTGHGTLRVAVAGMRQSITADEARSMRELLGAALAEGSAGFSTGLMYAPGSAAGFEELAPFCRMVKQHGRLYATHMRSYMGTLVEAVEEQLDLARSTGCRLQISHLQAAGRSNWDLQRRAIDKIEEAAREGIDVEFDIYPYQCGSTVLTQWMPDWALDGGMDDMCARLGDAADQDRIANYIVSTMAQRWEDITVTGVRSEANQFAVGLTLQALAEHWDLPPVEAMLRIIGEERGAVNIVSFNQSEDNLRQLITHPLCTVISDGFYVRGLPHPRLHGTFPELLGSLVRDRRWLDLTDAIHKVTAKPAARLGIQGRGTLEPGARADIVVFDPARIASRATYQKPEQDPAGIVAVFRGGKLVAGERLASAT